MPHGRCWWLWERSRAFLSHLALRCLNGEAFGRALCWAIALHHAGPGYGLAFESCDELMLHGLVGFQPALWIPSQAPRDEVQESIVVALQSLLKSLGTWSSSSSFGADRHSWLAHGIKEELLARALFDEVLLWRAKYLHDAGKLLLLVLSREDRVAGEEFCENTTKGPHVDRNAVAHA